MSLFSRRRAKRRIVVVTTVAWAFALDKQPCQKLCDSEAWTIVQSQGHGPTDLGHSAVHVGPCMPSLASVALLRWSPHDWPPPDRLPVAIRFLRLTL